MSYSAQNKKAFFSLVRAGGAHDAWAHSLNEFSEYYETNSTGNYNWNATYYLRPIESRKIPSILESHISILTNSSFTGGSWSTTRMSTTTDKSHMAQYRNFYAWTSIYSDDSIYERSEDSYTVNAFNDPYGAGSSFLLAKDRTSSVLFFPRNY